MSDPASSSNLSTFVWTLHRRDTGDRVADLVVVDADFPWLKATVIAYPGLEALRPLFAAELHLLEQTDGDVDAWEAAYARVTDAVSLRYPRGREVPDFLLHLEGERAWWCFTDHQGDTKPGS